MPPNQEALRADVEDFATQAMFATGVPIEKNILEDFDVSLDHKPQTKITLDIGATVDDSTLFSRTFSGTQYGYRNLDEFGKAIQSILEQMEYKPYSPGPQY